MEPVCVQHILMGCEVVGCFAESSQLCLSLLLSRAMIIANTLQAYLGLGVVFLGGDFGRQPDGSSNEGFGCTHGCDCLVVVVPSCLPSLVKVSRRKI